MNHQKRTIKLRTKIILSTMIPAIISFFLICSVLFTSLFGTLHKTAESELLQISQKYALAFESKVNDAMNYVSIIASTIESEAGTQRADRERLQKSIFATFDAYNLVDGSSIYFETDRYDGRDIEYKGTQYGTAVSGKIAYYFYKDDDKTAYLPEALENDIEFVLPHYTEAKKANKPVYTEPAIYEVDGKVIPMFTLTYPVRDSKNEFIGAVTADIFLEDIYSQIQNEKIYETGYAVITNDRGQIIYSPVFADVGKIWDETGTTHTSPLQDETSVFTETKSILNGKSALMVTKTAYIPQLDSSFYISVVAPQSEINAGGIRLMGILAALSLTVIIFITLLLYYLISKITHPIKEITESAYKISEGCYSARITGDYRDEFATVKDAINTMAASIEVYIKEAKNSLSILESILDGLDACIYVTVPATGEILFVNEYMKEHFNIKGDAIGQICYKILQEGMEDRCEFCPCNQLDQDTDTVVVWENRNTVTKRDYRNTDRYIEWVGGIKVHLQHSVDITDIKQYMNDKIKAEHEAFQLKHDKEKAEAAAQAKNDFLAKMSHEIRTPMNAVIGMTELILRKELPQEVFENALMIKSAGTNLLSIINDILDFSKIESGKLEIIETEYMLPSLVNDVISVIRVRLMDKTVQFTVHIDPDIPACLIGDEIRIRQMLINLLSNAVKYTNEGYVSLAISGEAGEGTVTLTIEISDSGIGIKEEDIGKLFGDFVQIDTEKNKGIEGTGLGLAISRNLCRLMGGDISARSEYGKGSAFTVVLPQKFQSYKPFASIDNAKEKSVLLYETRPLHRESITRSLESLNVAYKSVENIPAIFESLDKYQYVFISSFAYGSINPTLSKLDKPPQLVILSDITEMFAPKDARNLILPAHSLSIANILNDIYEDGGGIPVSGASFSAPDAKVLIVDDITANLKVGEGLLLPYEMQVTLCLSGKEAIDLVSKNQYDLIFMDHMMPEMDGLETTRHIRELERDYAQTIPIVALTANAVSGVKEMFVQNGMNDFLAKPIETAKLDAVLEKWIPQEKRKNRTASEQTEQSSELVEMLKGIPELSVPKALSVVGGSKNTYERIVRLSIRLMPENILRLEELIDGDLPNYAIEVHGVKGVLNNIGAYDLGFKAFELEKLSKNGDWDACKALHPGFIDKLRQFTDSVSALMANTDVEEKTEGDVSLLADVLHQLKDAIEFYDSVLALEILSSLDGQTFGQEMDEMINEMTSALERFDFDEAEGCIKKLEGRLE